MIKVFEVQTIERVSRTYLVQIDTKDSPLLDWPTEDLKALAEEQVRTGEIHKFTEGDAEIEEVLSVTES